MTTTAIAVRAAQYIAKVTTWWATRNDEAFRKERDEMFREWTAELAGALQLLQPRLEQLASEEATSARLDALSGSKEFWRVLDNYGYEAAREAIDERRRMLAHAAAGTFHPSLSVAQLARVERTLRELDPEDLHLLGTLEELAPVAYPAPTSAGASRVQVSEWLRSQQPRAARRHAAWQAQPTSGHILAAAGCILIQDYNLDTKVSGTSDGTFPVVVPVVTVTDLGRWVLSVTQLYRATLPQEDSIRETR